MAARSAHKLDRAARRIAGSLIRGRIFAKSQRTIEKLAKGRGPAFPKRAHKAKDLSACVRAFHGIGEDIDDHGGHGSRGRRRNNRRGRGFHNEAKLSGGGRARGFALACDFTRFGSRGFLAKLGERLRGTIFVR